MLYNIIKTPLLIITLLIFTSHIFAQTNDNIPRNRIVTDEELLGLLDYSNKNLSGVQSAFKNKNYEKAIILLSDYFRNRTSPRYFFDSKNIKEDIKTFKSLYPDEIIRIKKQADEFTDSYGTNLTWLLPGTDKHGRAYTPNTIRQLSRFAQSYEYFLSYFLENNPDRIKILFDQLRDFITDYQNGQTEKGGNDVFERFYAGHRTRNLLLANNLILNQDDYKWQDRIFMIKVFLLHGSKLFDACRSFNWGNHQLHGLAGLYEMTTMYPEFPVMRLWNDGALKIIMEHATKEIKEDGFQFERASHYFKLDIMNYFRMHKIAAVNNIKLPDLFERRFHKMFDAIVTLSTPDKSLPVLQDAQAFYKPQVDSLDNNDAAELTDPKESLFMSIGAAEFNNPVYKYFSSSTLPPDLYWFFSNSEKEKYSALSPETPKISSACLPETKYFVMRTGWGKNDLHLVIDGGLAEFKPDHTHGGVLGMALYGFGSELLPTYRVRYSEPSYRFLKNSLSKNVALADNILQGQGWISNAARTGFGIWENLPTPVLNDWITGDNFDYFSGSHNGFEKDSVTYNRSIVFFKPFFFIVTDEFNSSSYHSYQQIWQGKFNPLPDCNGALKTMPSGKLYVIQSDYTDMNIDYLTKYNLNSVRFEKTGVSSYSFSTVLYPEQSLDQNIPEVKQFNQKENIQVTVTNNNIKGILYRNPGKGIKSDEIKSDAKFVSSVYKSNQLVSFLIYEGTRCELEHVKVKCNKPSVLELSKSADGKWEYKVLKGTPDNVTVNY